MPLAYRKRGWALRRRGHGKLYSPVLRKRSATVRRPQVIVTGHRLMLAWSWLDIGFRTSQTRNRRARHLALVRLPALAAATRIRDDLRNGTARERRIASGHTGADMARVLHVTPQAGFWGETNQSPPTVPHALAYGRALAAVEMRAA